MRVADVNLGIQVVFNYIPFTGTKRCCIVTIRQLWRFFVIYNGAGIGYGCVISIQPFIIIISVYINHDAQIHLKKPSIANAYDSYVMHS